MAESHSPDAGDNVQFNDHTHSPAIRHHTGRQSKTYGDQPLHPNRKTRPGNNASNLPQDRRYVTTAKDETSIPSHEDGGIPVKVRITVGHDRTQFQKGTIEKLHQLDKLNFHLNQEGEIVRTNAGHPWCNYCFISSHSRDICSFRRIDLEHGIDHLVHPRKGLLQSRRARDRQTTSARAIDHF
jgi:hypothetical protein